VTVLKRPFTKGKRPKKFSDLEILKLLQKARVEAIKEERSVAHIDSKIVEVRNNIIRELMIEAGSPDPNKYVRFY